MAYSPSPLVLSRHPREIGSTWDDERSWFGGRPRLGHRTWPRNAASRPMTFMAQIDLEDVARCAGPSALPSDGALAFFIGEGRNFHVGCVVHVTYPRAAAPTEPPPDAPAAFEPGGDMLPTDAAPDAPRLFPRWPLDMTALPAGDDGQIDDAEVTARFTRREFFFSAEDAWKTLGDLPRPVWWHTAQLFALHLRTALRHLPARVEQQRGFVTRDRARLAKIRPTLLGRIAGLGSATPNSDVTRAEAHLRRNEETLTDLQRLAPGFDRFVAEVSAWADASPCWGTMLPEAVNRLRSVFARSGGEFKELTRYRVPYAFNDLETNTLLALMVAEERAFATLPNAMRALINERYLLPTDAWHQMFGRGVNIQGNPEGEDEDNVLLLQLMRDDMMGWKLGEMAVFQFWIDREDLIAGSWEAVRLTVECH